MSSAMYTGSCLCGGIQFEIDGELAPIQVCHCAQCRKAQGGPFATNIPVAVAAYRIVGGQNLLQQYESSPGKFRVFCRNCGAPLYSCRSAIADTIRVRAGSINGPLKTRPAAHAYFSARAEWWEINDDLPRFDGLIGLTPATVTKK